MLDDATSRLSALLLPPYPERQPMLAGSAALSLGYVGCTGRLVTSSPALRNGGDGDIEMTKAEAAEGAGAAAAGGASGAEAAPAAEGAGGGAAAGGGEEGIPSGKGATSNGGDAGVGDGGADAGSVLLMISRLLPKSTIGPGQGEGGQAATLAVARATTALGLGCRGEDRRPVLRGVVKGGWGRSSFVFG